MPNYLGGGISFPTFAPIFAPQGAQYKPNKLIMKKFFLLLTAAVAMTTVRAEGYQVNNLSSKQNGMGHVGTAMKLNSESLWFNPAAAAFQSSFFDFSGGVTGIATKATYTSLPDYKGTPLSHFQSDNKISTPLFFYANFKPTPWMSAGLAVTTPFGSSMNWGDNWIGAQLVQSIDLKAYNVQPTVSFRIGRHFSVGAGLMLTWGTFDLSRSLFPVGTQTNGMLDQLLQQAMPGTPPVFAGAGDRSLLSVSLEGNTKLAVGVNLGLMWDINDEWSLGFSYRSKLTMKVKEGTAALRMIDDPAIATVLNALNQQLHLLPDVNSAIVKTELPLPATFTWGVSFRPVPKWEFAVDLQYVLWSAYDRLDVQFLDAQGNSLYDLPASMKNYSNTLAFRFGGQYHAFRWMTARMGMYVDESPVSSDFLNPETPSMTKMAYTAGLSFRPVQFLSIDVAYGYVRSADPERTGSYPYVNPLIQRLGIAQGLDEATAIRNATSAFSGNYTAEAHTFSIGVNLHF